MEQIEEKEIRPYDVIVIGAGAAGMMAAGTAARDGKRVLLIEKMEKSGRKVRSTGKGRCNVTNARPAEEFADQVRTNAEFFKVACSEFNNRAAIKFFERAGVKLDIERGDRVFPQSGKAWESTLFYLEFGGFGILPNDIFGENLLPVSGRKIRDKQPVSCGGNGRVKACLTPQRCSAILQKTARNARRKC